MSAFAGQQASDHSRQHNGNVYNNYYHAPQSAPELRTSVTPEQHANNPSEQRTKYERKPLDNGFWARRARAKRNEKLPDAIYEGQLRRVIDLLEEGADPNYMVGTGSPMLMIAVVQCHIAVAKALIQAGADLRWEAETGKTVLHIAAQATPRDGNEQGAMVAMLIKADADVKHKTYDGAAPLHFANTAGAAEQLILNGADINCADNDGDTPLHWRHGVDADLLIEHLILAGADMSARNKEGLTPLGRWKALAKHEGESEEHIKTIAVLEKHGVPE